jgi:hypothetical protein
MTVTATCGQLQYIQYIRGKVRYGCENRGCTLRLQRQLSCTHDEHKRGIADRRQCGLADCCRRSSMHDVRCNITGSISLHRKLDHCTTSLKMASTSSALRRWTSAASRSEIAQDWHFLSALEMLVIADQTAEMMIIRRTSCQQR